MPLENIAPETKKLANLARFNTKLSIVFELDLVNDRIDIRQSSILDIQDSEVVIRQTTPPMTHLPSNKSFEVSLVHANQYTGEAGRWGWQARLLSYMDKYRVRREDQETEKALIISAPLRGELTKSNIRLGYRVRVRNPQWAEVRVKNFQEPLRLEDFSVGGVLLGLPLLRNAQDSGLDLEEGKIFHLSLTIFLPPENVQRVSINTEVELVRTFSVANGLKAGFRFIGLGSADSRSLSRAINHYMHQERKTVLY